MESQIRRNDKEEWKVRLGGMESQIRRNVKSDSLRRNGKSDKDEWKVR
jgi:hypothetical protein